MPYVTYAVGDRVRTHSLSQAAFNNRCGVVQGYEANQRVRVLLDGENNAKSFKPANLVLAQGGAATAFLNQVLSKVPPAYQPQLQQAAARLDSTIADVQRHLPPNMKLSHLAAGLVAVFLVSLYMFGFMRTALLFSAVSFFVSQGFRAWSNNGGGRSGLSAAAEVVGNKIKSRIFSVTGFTVPPRRALLIAVGLVLALFWVLGPATSASVGPSRGASSLGSSHIPDIDPEDDVDVDLTLTYKDAYLAGWKDHENGASKFQGLKNFPDAPPKRSRPSYDHTPPRPPPSSYSPSHGGGRSSGFGLFQLLPIGVLGYQGYHLGKKPMGGWSPQIAMDNARRLPTGRKVMMGFLLLRVLGLSPI